MFHGVSATRDEKIEKELQPHLDAKEFEKVIIWLNKRFRFINVDEFIKSKKNGILITFDDGFANNRKNVVPILEKFNIPALIFFSTKHVKNPNDWLNPTKKLIKKKWHDSSSVPVKIANDFYNGMSEKDVIWCSKHPLITIGSHTNNHPFLTKVSEKDLYEELVQSKKYLESLTGKKIEYFAYPYGDYNKDVATLVKKVGYKAAFCTEKLKYIGMPFYEIQRIGIYSNSKYYLSSKLSGLNIKPHKSNFD